MSEYSGTVTSKLKPIVTMLTEELVRDFAPAYRRFDESLWVRTGDDGTEMLVSEDQLHADVRNWLMDLENRMENESDREFAKMCVQMIRKNKGWVALLARRVVKRIG